MLRTQVLLETWQYRFLKEQARRSGRSLSATLRELLNSVMTPPRTRHKKIFSICGIIKESDASGREHNHFLYNHPCKNSL